MLLLENAKIPASVYTAVVTQLVANATSRPHQHDDIIYIMGKDKLESMLNKDKKAAQAHATMITAQQPAGDESNCTPSFCLTELKTIEQLIETGVRASQRHDSGDRTSLRLLLMMQWKYFLISKWRMTNSQRNPPCWAKVTSEDINSIINSVTKDSQTATIIKTGTRW